MPPRKESFGHTNYLKRSIHDDFLKQFLPSINEITIGRQFIPKNPRLVVVEGFYDKANWLIDAQVSV